MSLSAFFLITAIVSALFGVVTLLAPGGAVKSYGFEPTPALLYIFRVFGAAILSAGVLNFLVRDEAPSVAVKAVLIFNGVFYAIRILNDVLALNQKLFTISKIYISAVIHLFICIGSVIYLVRLG